LTFSISVSDGRSSLRSDCFFQAETGQSAFALDLARNRQLPNGGLPVVVTFCPLCNAALVFARPVVYRQRLTFGTSGNLRHSDLIMWDRQTEL
jgi:hypothetical protein